MKKTSGHKAVIIIPTYNERENIAKVIPILLDVFTKIKTWDMHILVVDDTSPDKTYEVVQGLTKKHPNVHLVINKQKAGLGGAYLRGMAEAFDEMNADLVFEFDADLSHDPQQIPAFLAKIDQGYDFVLGSRYVAGGGIPQDWGLHRKFLSVFGNIIIMTVLTDFRIRDWTTGYRAITRNVYEAVHPEVHGQRFSGYTFQIGFLHKAVRKGFKVAEVPFKFVDRTDGQSKLGPEYIKNTLLYIFKVRAQEIIQHRLFKFAAVGGIGSVVQLLSLQLLWAVLKVPYQLAFFLSIEAAIVSNFVLNNIWTFADRKLEAKQIPQKFVAFNIASSGSIIIQQLVALVGQFVIGFHDLLRLPVVNVTIGTAQLYVVVGIFLGLFWNFFAYNAFIWKKTAPGGSKPVTN